MTYQNEHEEFSMVQECTDEYSVREIDNKIKISILVPKKFKYLWMHKLSELKTTETEIQEYSDTILEYSDEK